jgi:hypothetical protein
MHKTGSTSIQESLRGFENDRFVYADLGGSVNHSLPIYSAFAADPTRHHLHRTAGRADDTVQTYIDKALKDLDRSIARAGRRTLLISGEDIGLMAAADLVKLREHFKQRFDDLRLVAYVRPPAGFIASSFQQRVRNSAADWRKRERLYRNYQANFGKFDDLFGRENVQLWKFDPEAFPESCVVRDFCARLGIALAKDKIVRRNDSLSLEAVRLLYTYSKFEVLDGAPPLRGGESLKLGLTAAASGRKFRISPDVLRPILEKNRADIEWMEARLGQSLREDLGEHRDGDVREENDLLLPDPEVSGRLRTLLGRNAPPGVAGKTAEEVAVLVHALRQKLGPGGKQAKGAAPQRSVAEPPSRAAAASRSVAPIKIPELIDEMQRYDADVLNGIPENRARQLIREVFRHIDQTLSEAEEGAVTYAGLGRFRITKVETQVDGKKLTRLRYAFHLASGGTSVP